MKLDGKIAMVTGAGRGIGRAIAKRLADEGAHVLLTARTQSELDTVQAEIEKANGRALALPADVTDDVQIRRLFAVIFERFGRLDILVNNAGLGKFSPVRNLSVADFDTMWNVNVRGVFLCTQKAIPIMERQRDGVIVNISSLAGKNAFVNGAGYAATKWALIGFSRCLMLEERSFNIRVVTVCPGSVETSFSGSDTTARKTVNIIAPSDVAEVVLGAVTMPSNSMVSEIDIRPTNPS